MGKYEDSRLAPRSVGEQVHDKWVAVEAHAVARRVERSGFHDFEQANSWLEAEDLGLLVSPWLGYLHEPVGLYFPYRSRTSNSRVMAGQWGSIGSVAVPALIVLSNAENGSSLISRQLPENY